VHSWERTVGFLAFKFEVCLVLEESDKLIGGKDWADFDFVIDLLELEALPWFEVHGPTNLFRDDDLVFG